MVGGLHILMGNNKTMKPLAITVNGMGRGEMVGAI
jgi:hypothetical protein